MIELIAVLLLVAFMVLIITALVLMFARGMMWWQDRKFVANDEELWDPSDREGGDRGRPA